MNEANVKTINEVFKDFNTQCEYLSEAEIKSINLFKKTNILEIELLTKGNIDIKSIFLFEQYLEKRFQIKEVKIKLEFENEINSDEIIANEWKDITEYLALKHPLTKAILAGSNIKIDGNTIKVNIIRKGKDFLIAKKIDETTSDILVDLYSKKYKVEFTENISEESIEKIKENIANREKEIIKEVQKNAEEEMKQKQIEEEKTKEDAMFKSLEEQINRDDFATDEDYLEELNRLEEEMEENHLILGNPSKAKENKVKISEISAGNAKITIEGRIVSVNVIETKTGKGMITFELYDGSGIITCKGFTKNIEEGNVAVEKIKSESGIKVTGRAGLNNFSNDVEVMADKIIGVDGENFPKLPTEDEDSPLIYGLNPEIKFPMFKIQNIGVDSGNVCIDGEVITIEDKELKGGKILASIAVYDGTNTIICKVFLTKDNSKKVLGKIKDSKGIKVAGKAEMDKFAGEITITANTIVKSNGLEKEVREDNAEVKRVELSVHTQMSMMDGIPETTAYIKRAQKWGMPAIAITDGGSVQAFSDAHKMLGFDLDDQIKVLYGMEAYLVADNEGSIFGNKDKNIEDTTFCVLDLETTGRSYRAGKITEIGIMKVKNGEVIEEFDELVDPEMPIPDEVVEITHITNDMVKGKPTIDVIMPKALEFIGDSVVVTHNTDFDIGWMRYNCNNLGLEFNNTYLDTLRLSKKVYPNFTKYKLGLIADKLGIEVDVAHRALADVDTTVKVLNKMLDEIKGKGAVTLEDIDKVFEGQVNWKTAYPPHCTIFATNYVGLRNLYKLVSISHLYYMYAGMPHLLKSILTENREGLILGSGNGEGELYQAVIQGKDDEELEEIAKFYDYLEIQPIGNNFNLIRHGTIPDENGLIEINKKIVEIGERLEIPVCATSDVHFMEPKDEIYRRILRDSLQRKDRDADYQPPLYFRTTEEMLKEFEYLGYDKAYEVVVTNTNKVANMCDKISPISPEKCPPHIEGCEQTIKDIAYDKAHELYGEKLPQIVEERLEKELTSIINNGFSVMYIIAQKLVWKSNEDGYIVGSRGSVGSSFVANMTGITEVNSLPPHYRCPKCKYSDFTDYGCQCGFDLPDKACPECGTNMVKDGIDIPFETFLGFNGDKEPDIDLNFSGEYQAKAHRYTEVIFGKGTTFKAGTVGTVADKTAYGYVKKYHEEHGIIISNPEVARISAGCVGVKRTTGQHPGGIIVVPKGREIYEFTPVQHPADDPESDIITTHFDYHSIDQNLLKLDILGHDDPTMIRMLYDLTDIDPTKVPLDDKETMSIFSSTDALGVTPEQINSKVGSYGIPEFGTKFVRGMLVDTKPKTFDELIRISGLSHGTDVWLGNAQSLIDEGTVTLQEAICCRDDIMIYLIKKGVPPNPAFKIMEVVRKGKALKDKDKWADYTALMRENNVPEWYIKSCEKIKYMFPKAHAAAYVTNAFRIAWFKVHQPKAYYTAYFTIRADEFDSEIMCYGKERVKNKMKEIDMAGNDASTKDKNMYAILELVLEMYERGIKFLPIDLYKSHATKFQIEEDGIRPPLNSAPGLGTVAAEGIDEAKKDGKFMSIEDLKIRAKIGNSVIDLLQKMGCLDGMSQSNQMSLFG